MTNTTVPLEIEPTEMRLQQYHADGYLILRHLFAEGEVGEWESEAARLLEWKDLIDNNNVRCRWQNHVETDQDYISWKSFPTSFVTAIVAIDPSDSDNGATEAFPGYHQRGCLSRRDGRYHELPAKTVDASKGVVLSWQPGDVAVFSGCTPHKSDANRSKQYRRLLYLSYNALSDGGEQREKHYTEFHAWLKDRYAEYGKTNAFFR